MAYTETIGTYVEVLEDGQIQVCTITHVLRDGVEIHANRHRVVVAPGDDISNRDPRVASVAAVLWTPEVVAAFKRAQKEQGRP